MRKVSVTLETPAVKTPKKIKDTRPRIWVLLKEVNDYNQYGDYFIATWLEKPTISQVKECLGCNDELAEHVTKGGGRRGCEGIWYTLSSYIEGMNYGED